MRLLLIACLVLGTSGCAQSHLALRQVFHSAQDDEAAARVMARFDKDHDGELSLEEYLTLCALPLDGLVSSLEKEQREVAERLRQKPDRQDLVKLQRQLPARLKEAREGRKTKLAKRAAEFAYFDFNRDGRLSARELAAGNDTPLDEVESAPG